MFYQQSQGFVLALTSMVLYGLYMVPRRKSSASAGVFTFWMGWGILVSTTIIAFISGDMQHVGIDQYLMMFLSGILWATGTLGYLTSVQLIGLSRSTPIKNTSAVLGTLFGILIFHEFSFDKYLPLGFAIIGSGAIVASATLLGRVEIPDDVENPRVNTKVLVYGVLCSLWAAIAYSAYTIPMKIAYSQGISPSAFLLYMGQGCFMGMSILAIIIDTNKPKEHTTTWKDRNLAQLAGIMWAVGSLCANSAVKLIGIAITWPITKSTFVAVLYGVFILKEINVKKHRTELNTGLLLSVIGVVLLGWAMSLN